MKPLYCFVLSVSLSITSYAQVDAIKGASSAHGSGGSRESSRDSGGDWYVGIAVQSIDLFVIWQQHTLAKKEENPNVVSLDLYLQTAIQPSSYYIANPRIRANWGIFSTDYRMNYLIEEDFDGMKHIRTDDWQIVQVNVVTEKNVTVRVGAGILHENFSGGKTFEEWTVGTQLLSNDSRYGGVAEYRWAEPRKEVSAHFQYALSLHRHFQTYLTTGLTYQRYYHSIDVWGMQGGLMFRVR